VYKNKKNCGVDSFVIKEWYSNCNILNFYVSHGSTARFLGGGEKYYSYFAKFVAVSSSERIFKIG